MKMLHPILRYFDPNFLTEKNFLKNEFVGGFSTFLAMSYILFVNPTILSTTGMSKEALFTTTCLMGMIGTFLMGAIAKYPIALAPGMGTNAFFTFTLVATLGLTWQQALAAIFISGILMILTSLSNIRKYIVELLPPALKEGISLGVGAFILFLGLKQSGLIVADKNTLLTLGNLFSTQSFLVILGFLTLLLLDFFNVLGSVVISILLISTISFFLGLTSFSGIISLPPSISPIFNHLDFSHIFSLDFINIIIIVFIMDFFDSTGVLTGIMSKIHKNGQKNTMKKALAVDGFASTLGAFLGTSTVTSYAESLMGVKSGAKNGLSSVFVAFFFFLALFFSPLLSFIPPFATTPALIYIGFSILKEIDGTVFQNKIDTFSAIVAAVTMPLTFSIMNGIMFASLIWSFQHFFIGSFFKKSFLSKYFMIPVIGFLLLFVLYYHSLL